MSLGERKIRITEKWAMISQSVFPWPEPVIGGGEYMDKRGSWEDLLTIAQNRQEWQVLSAATSIHVQDDQSSLWRSWTSSFFG